MNEDLLLKLTSIPPRLRLRTRWSVVIPRKWSVPFFAMLVMWSGWGLGHASSVLAEPQAGQLDFRRLSLPLQINVSFSTPANNSSAETSSMAHFIGIYPVHLSADPGKQSLLLLRHQTSISGFAQDHKQLEWTQAWQRDWETPCGAGVAGTQVGIVDLFGSGRDVAVVRARRGLQFYRILNLEPGLTFLGQDGRFDSVYGWCQPEAVVEWGRIFHDKSLLGFITRNPNREIKLYALDSRYLSPQNSYPLLNFNLNMSLPPTWSDPTTTLFVVQLSSVHSQQEWIGSWSTTGGLCLHNFDEHYILHTCQVSMPNLLRLENRRMFWAAVTNTDWKDLILWTENSGLVIYKYVTSGTQAGSGTYVFHSEFRGFSAYFGWTPEHVSSMWFMELLGGSGGEELIALGPNQLEVYQFTNGSVSSILARDALPISLKYAKPVGAAWSQFFVQDPVGNLHYSGEHRLVPLTPEEDSNEEPLPIASTSSSALEKGEENDSISVPSMQRRHSAKLSVHWLDKWGNKLANPIDEWGNVNIVIPLFDQSLEAALPGMSLGLRYNTAVQVQQSEQQLDPVGGYGWNLPLLDKFIVADQTELMTSYRWHSGSNSEQLNRLSGNGSGYSTTISTLTFDYSEANQSWTSESEHEITRYAAVQWSLTGRTWAGPFRADDMNTEDWVRIPIRWFISERLSKRTGAAFRYEYEHEDGGHGLTYTTSVRLIGIKNTGLGSAFSVRFAYEEKEASEYTSRPSPFDSNRNMGIFPVRLTYSKYLNRVEVSHEMYEQIFRFEYILNRGTRVLTGIKQLQYTTVAGAAMEPLMSFEYDDNTGLLTGLEIHNQFKHTFMYGAIPQYWGPTLAESRLEINEQGSLTVGPDFLLHTYVVRLNPNYVVMQFVSPDGSKALMRLTTEVLAGSAERIVSQQALVSLNSIYLLVRTDEAHLHVYTFERKARDNDEWTWAVSPNLHERFSNESAVKASAGGSLLVVQDPDQSGQVIVFEHASPAGVTRSSLRLQAAPGALAVDTNLIVGYNDDTVRVLHRHEVGGNWTQVLDYKVPGIISTSRAAIARFDLSSRLEKLWQKGVAEEGCVLLAKNLIVLRGIEHDNGWLYVKLKLLVLESHGGGPGGFGVRIGRVQAIHDARTNVLALRATLEDRDGNYFQVQYELNQQTGKYEIKIISFSGPMMDDINKIGNRNQRDDAEARTLHGLNTGDGWKVNRKERSLVDWNPVRTQVLPSGVVFVGNDTAFAPGASSWSKVPIAHMDMVTRLGTRFVLKHNLLEGKQYDIHDAVDSHPHGRLLLSLRVDPPHFFINAFPLFIAYQETPSRVGVLTFREGGKSLGRTHIFENEKLQLASGYAHLITSTDATASAGPQFIVRSPSALVQAERPVVSRIHTKGAGTIPTCEQTTKYEYQLDHDLVNGTMTKSILTTPGGVQSASGWTEDRWTTTHSQNGSKAVLSRTISVYASDGKLVQMQTEERTKQSESHANTSDGSSVYEGYEMLDASRRWTILDRYPHSAQDDMMDYFGFEAYETNRASEWGVDQSRIVDGGWAYTGKRYLHLGAEATTGVPAARYLTRKLVPRDQVGAYVVGAWLREGNATQREGRVGMTVKYFKAVFQATDDNSSQIQPELYGLLGQVKAVDGAWAYVEIVLDFSVAQDIYNDFVYYSNPSTNFSSNHTRVTTTLSVTIQLEFPLENSTESFVDVDHIAFYPLEARFMAKVYDSTHGKPTEVIEAEGRVARAQYNRIGAKVAAWTTSPTMVTFEQYVSHSSSWNRRMPRSSLTLSAPEEGRYENFDLYSMQNRWSATDLGWRRAPGQLIHEGNIWSKISLRQDSILHGTESESVAIYLQYSLDSATHTELKFEFRNPFIIQFNHYADGSTLCKAGNDVGAMVGPTGELIILIEGSRQIVFINGAVFFDKDLDVPEKGGPKAMDIFASGDLWIGDMFLLRNPRVEVQYYNSLGLPTQLLQLENSSTVIVKETLYDSLGRPTLVTKVTRLARGHNEALLRYQDDFIINRQCVSPADKLMGLVSDLNPADEGYPFVGILYEKTPLKGAKPLAVGHPGVAHSIDGPFAQRFVSSVPNESLAWVHNVFPTRGGYQHEAKLFPNGKLRVQISDKLQQTAGLYVHGLGYEHSLTTYEYNQQKQLTKVVPPVFHDRVGTLRKRDNYNVQMSALSDQAKALKEDLSTTYTYDEAGRLARKTTPDAADQGYMHSPDGHIRFVLSLNKTTKEVIKVKYFFRDTAGQLVRTGHLTKILTRGELEQYLPDGGAHIPADIAADHQRIFYADKKKRIITQVTGSGSAHPPPPVLDELEFNPTGQVTVRRSISATHSYTLKKEYDRKGQLRTLTYPDGLLSLHHTYNKLDQLVALGTSADPTRFATFTYNADGQLSTETRTPGPKTQNQGQGSQFVRHFKYNSPGWLQTIDDPFMEQSLSYTTGGYGQGGYDEGIVMNTTFKNKWPTQPASDTRNLCIRGVDMGMLGIHNDTDTWRMCLQALKRTGHLTAQGRPLKPYGVVADSLNMPTQCGGRIANHLSQQINQKLWATFSGFSYAYGNQGELTKAKHYFSHEAEASPFGSKSFAQYVPTVNESESVRLWNRLKVEGYIYVEGAEGDRLSSLAKSFFREDALQQELANVSEIHALVYKSRIRNLILRDVNASQRTPVTPARFHELVLQWSGFVDGPAPQLLVQQRRSAAASIFQALQQGGWLSASGHHALDSGFLSIVHPYNVSAVVGALLDAQENRVGQDPFDYESFRMDGNGNNHLSYSGSRRYNFSYVENTNKISRVNMLSPSNPEGSSYAINYDEFGNVAQAEHKGIRHIAYDPVSNRPTVIDMDDGRQLRFTYDGQGERVLKEVFRKGGGGLQRQVRYSRDETGRVLFEQETIYADTQNRTEVVDSVTTAYIYGPLGHLLGFIRNGIYNNVLTDHAGSVRLIVRDGRVVTAYDYAPYGELRRCFGCDDPRSQTSYKFTGQEYDEETGLYNFHARMYDPELGRFYIVDPRSQYLSPYTYAGNSPLSLVDPDGELAFLIIGIAIGASVGSYLGGAAANNRWNPADWDFKHSSTYLGMLGGGIAGGLLPVGFGASVSALGGGALGITSTVALGSSGAYLLGASSNQNWNPARWAWGRPHTYSALFQGFVAGSSMPAGIKGVHTYATSTFKSAGSKVLIGSSYAAGGGVAYVGAALGNGGKWGFWEWDWTSPVTWSGIFYGFNSGFGWPTGFTMVGRGIGKAAHGVKAALSKTAANAGTNSRIMASIGRTVKSTLANPASPFHKFVAANLMAYLNGAMANNDFDVTNWNFASFSTYEGILNGAFLGKDVSLMLHQLQPLRKTSRVAETQTQVQNPRIGPIKKWMLAFTDFAKSIHQYWKNQKQNPRRSLTDLTDSFKNERLRELPDAIKSVAVTSRRSLPSQFRDLELEITTQVRSGSRRRMFLDRDRSYIRFGADDTDVNTNRQPERRPLPDDKFNMDPINRAPDDAELEVNRPPERRPLSEDLYNFEQMHRALDDMEFELHAAREPWERNYVNDEIPTAYETYMNNCPYCTAAGMTRSTVRKLINYLLEAHSYMDIEGSAAQLKIHEIEQLFKDVGFEHVYTRQFPALVATGYNFRGRPDLLNELRHQIPRGEAMEFGLAYTFVERIGQRVENRGHVVVLKAWHHRSTGEIGTRIIDFQQPPDGPNRFRENQLPTGDTYLIHASRKRQALRPTPGKGGPRLDDNPSFSSGASTDSGGNRRFGLTVAEEGQASYFDPTGWIEMKTGVTVGGFVSSGARRAGNTTATENEGSRGLH